MAEELGAAAIPTHLPELFLAFATTLLAHPPPPQEPHPVDAHCSLSAAITSLFGFLYGLAPCNFLAFLRSPTDALQAFRPDTPGPALDALLHRAARLPLDTLHALVLPIIDQHRLAPHILRPDPAAERKELAHRLRLCEPAEILETCQRTRIQAPCPSPPIPNRLLRTQLHVELYLRSQHLQQLGSVHKQHIGGAGLEAENQNLLRMNKELRKKLALNLGARPDAQAASAADQRNKAVYHALIKARNAKLKEDNLALISTRAALRGQLAEQAKVVAIQAANLAAVHAEAHELRNRLALQAPQLRVLAGLELQTARLARALLVWDDDLRRIRAAAGRVDALRASWKQAASAAASLETEAARLRAALQSQQTRIAALEAANAALSARAAVSQRQAGRDPAVARLAALVDRYRALNAALTRRITAMRQRRAGGGKTPEQAAQVAAGFWGPTCARWGIGVAWRVRQAGTQPGCIPLGWECARSPGPSTPDHGRQPRDEKPWRPGQTAARGTTRAENGAPRERALSAAPRSSQNLCVRTAAQGPNTPSITRYGPDGVCAWMRDAEGERPVQRPLPALGGAAPARLARALWQSLSTGPVPRRQRTCGFGGLSGPFRPRLASGLPAADAGQQIPSDGQARPPTTLSLSLSTRTWSMMSSVQVTTHL
ncbi:hypothetical protein PtA15_16A375 [Puccinia triticina]|uniref:Uncharacterized protein n=1 Tax=Puccinia triticina TaxID=208348 RepID=A0ABY7D717_9BASI|nr:uncharacterized protein PtA15_16A375 [Puccinia triticina]WAQ92467.1 hypothetical protein PtA15_16A375 [Puccinia triticina]